jgi:hypothetical protein
MNNTKNTQQGGTKKYLEHTTKRLQKAPRMHNKKTPRALGVPTKEALKNTKNTQQISPKKHNKWMIRKQSKTRR